ncbi:MAG TPA: hypothetical protein ENI23_02150 [bacterium]|nr:hypothetical protein [bacterium]
MSETPNKKQKFDEVKKIIHVSGIRFKTLKMIAIGTCNTLAFTQNGDLYAWGMEFTTWGAKRIKDYGNRHTPGLLIPPSGEIWDTIVTGPARSLGMTQSKNLYSIEESYKEPKLLKALEGEKWEKVASHIGGGIVYLFTEKGNVYTWDWCKLRCVEEFHWYLKLFEAPYKEKWKEIIVGLGFFFGFTYSDNVYAWGRGKEGQLGLGDFDSTYTPELLECPLGEKWKKIVAGGGHSFGITQANNVYGWGENAYHQLGLKHSHNRCTPELLKPPFGKRWKEIVVGSKHSFGIVQSGEVYGWGENKYGVLGWEIPFFKNMKPINKKGSPRVVTDNIVKHPELLKPPNNESWKRIFTGNSHSFGVTNSGNMYAFGRALSGQLGLGDETSDRFSPQLLKSPEGTKWGRTTWPLLRTLFIAHFKEPSSPLYKENLPNNLFRTICYLILQDNGATIIYEHLSIDEFHNIINDNKTVVAVDDENNNYSTNENDSGYTTSEWTRHLKLTGKVKELYDSVIPIEDRVDEDIILREQSDQYMCFSNKECMVIVCLLKESHCLHVVMFVDNDDYKIIWGDLLRTCESIFEEKFFYISCESRGQPNMPNFSRVPAFFSDCKSLWVSNPKSIFVIWDSPSDRYAAEIVKEWRNFQNTWEKKEDVFKVKNI